MRDDRVNGLFGRVALVLAVSWTAIAAPGCSELPTEPADVSQMTVRGITLADWTADGYSSAQALVAVDDIALLGANALPIVVTLYQNNATDNEPRVDPQLTPTETSVADIIVRAQARSLGVSLKIHIDLYDGEWRGQIAPSNPGLWFENYKKAMAPWVVLADALDVPMAGCALDLGP